MVVADATTAIQDALGKAVKRLETLGQYADALYLEQRQRTLIKDSTGIEARDAATSGVKLRVYDGQRFHEACIQGVQPSLIQEEAARLIARVKASVSTAKPRPLRLDRKIQTKTFETSGTTLSTGEQVRKMTSIYDTVLSKGFTACTITLSTTHERRVFVNGQKSLSSTWTGCAVTVIPFIRATTGEVRSDFFRKFANGAAALDVPQKELDQFLKRAARLKDAKRVPPGKHTVVLSPNVSGLLAHESFGHGMEADTVMHGRAKASEFIGKRIANARVSICDDPGLERTYGMIHFDDEGMLPERVFLVERGVVRDPITDLYSASALGIRRSANARAESFDRKSYARMTNTFFLPGKDSPEQMIKTVKEGFYLHHGSSGMEDPKGWGVQIAGLLCERIKNGKLTGEYFVEATMSGYLPDILDSITAVGSDFSIEDDAGHCGKGHKDWVRVSSGGPHLKITKVDLA